jgi:hypothetical protein
MTIVRFLPQWLRARLLKPASPRARVPSKKDGQILLTETKPQSAQRPAKDDERVARFRIYWRM